MPTIQFNRNSVARRYAKEHLKTDPGLVCVYYLPAGSAEREIRLVEVNKLIGERTDDSLEPIDFGVDRGSDNEHRLLVLDVTPAQWKRIQARKISLPNGWSLDQAVRFPPK